MRYILTLAGLLSAVLWSMNRTESTLGASLDMVSQENRITMRYMDTALDGQDASINTSLPGQSVRLTVVSQENGEHFVSMSDPLPVTLGEVSGIARYVGMLRLGFERAGEISAASATIEEVWEYEGNALRWQLRDGGLLYCMPVRDGGLATFSSALVWSEPPLVTNSSSFYTSLDLLNATSVMR